MPQILRGVVVMVCGYLSDIPVGEPYIISEIELQGDIRRRLMEMGFVPYTSVCCEYIAPGGSPKAFRIKGALVALRDCDCRQISVLPYV